MPLSSKPADAVAHNNVLTPSIDELAKVLDLAHDQLQARKNAGNADLQDAHADAYAKVGLWVEWLQGLSIPQRLQIAADALSLAGECVPLLTLSTCHVCEGTANWLDEMADGMGNCPTIAVYSKGEFGWWIHHMPAFGPIEAVPEDLQPLLCYCFDRGIEWLCLDRDGPEDDQFPRYDW